MDDEETLRKKKPYSDLFKEQEVFMEQNKVQLFEDQPIRTAWDEEGEE